MKDRVLVIDDDPDVRTMISVALGRNGFTVELCGSSTEALDRARSFRPDLILLDVMMPGLDGPETLKVLRADEATASIPIVFMSAGIDRHDAPQFMELGALGVIPKPFDPALLPATLRRFRGAPLVAETAPADARELREAILGEFSLKVRDMETDAAALVTAGWDKATVESLFARAHRMAGSAGLFGLDGVAAAAGILAAFLKRLLEDPQWPPSRSAADVATLVRAVATAGPRRGRRQRGARPSVEG